MADRGAARSAVMLPKADLLLVHHRSHVPKERYLTSLAHVALPPLGRLLSIRFHTPGQHHVILAARDQQLRLPGETDGRDFAAMALQLECSAFLITDIPTDHHMIVAGRIEHLLFGVPFQTGGREREREREGD